MLFDAMHSKKTVEEAASFDDAVYIFATKSQVDDRN